MLNRRGQSQEHSLMRIKYYSGANLQHGEVLKSIVSILYWRCCPCLADIDNVPGSEIYSVDDLILVQVLAVQISRFGPDEGQGYEG